MIPMNFFIFLLFVVDSIECGLGILCEAVFIPSNVVQSISKFNGIDVVCYSNQTNHMRFKNRTNEINTTSTQTPHFSHLKQ